MRRRSGQVYLEGIRKASASCTKRSDDETWDLGFLAIVSSLFDPLGFIAPYTMKAYCYYYCYKIFAARN